METPQKRYSQNKNSQASSQVIRPQTVKENNFKKKLVNSKNLDKMKKRPITQQIHREALSNIIQQKQQDKSVLMCEIFDQIIEDSLNIPIHEAIEKKLQQFYSAEKCIVWLNIQEKRTLFSPTLNFSANYNDTLPGFIFRSGTVIQVRDPTHAPGGFEMNSKITPPHTPQLLFPLITSQITRGVIQVIGHPHSLGFSDYDSTACSIFMKKMRIYGNSIFNRSSIESIAKNYFSVPQTRTVTFSSMPNPSPLETISKYFHTEFCELWRCDIVRDVAQLLNLERHDSVSYTLNEAGLVGQAASSGTSISCANPQEHPAYQQKTDGQVNGAVLIIPMQLGDREVWCLALRGRKNIFSAIEESEVTALVWFVVGTVAGFNLSPERSIYVTHLTELLSVGHDVISHLSLTKIANIVCERACRLLECEEGFINLLDHKKRFFSPFFGKPNTGNFAQKVSVQQGLCGLTIATLIPQFRTWPSDDPAFDPEIDSLPEIVPRSFLSVPIFDQSNEVIGVTVLINKVHLDDFEEHDAKVLAALNTFAGIALSNALKYRTFSKITARLKQFVETAMNTNLESELKPMLQRIITKTRSILSASRVSFFIVNNGTDKLELFMNDGKDNLYSDIFAQPLRDNHAKKAVFYDKKTVRKMKENSSIQEIKPLEKIQNKTVPSSSNITVQTYQLNPIT